MLNFIETDNGNCRVYYRKGVATYCFQEDSPNDFTFYVCSGDGEPSREAKFSGQLRGLPEDDSATSKSFRAWFEKNLAWETWV